MKVIGGKWKSHPLKAPKGSKTRPTLGKVRESLFDIIQARVSGASVLDLFAGSGAIGIEALSRGAAQATFVEKDVQAYRCLLQNIETLSLKSQAFPIKNDVAAATKRLLREKRTFSLVYLDPPYALDIGPVLDTLAPLLDPDGLLIVEQAKQSTLSSEYLHLSDKRIFGDTTLYFFVPIKGRKE